MEKQRKILIDTDIGDDIDDAFAILSAMSLDFDIIGITTVFRDTDSRARMAKKLLHTFGSGYEKVPVYAGYDTYASYKEQNTQHMCRFSEELACAEYAPENRDPEDAVDFIIDCCKRYGKELTIIAIGPFCNIAKVIEKSPDALPQADKVVIMGGAYFKQYADWNVMCDVPAADIMFRSLPNLECIGADVTHLLASDYLKDILSQADNGILGYVGALYRQWQADYPDTSLVLHDALAIYYVYDSSICVMHPIRTAVVCDGFAKGITLNVDAYSKASLNSAYSGYDFTHSVLAAADVDLNLFHQLLQQDIAKCQSVHIR